MSKKPNQSKWHEIKKQAESNDAPVDNAARIKRLYLDTQIGSPIDTLEEVDSQRHNLGPKDTGIELKEDELDSQNRPSF